MAISLREGRLTFHFPDNASVSQYDDWAFYRRQFNACFGGTKAIDFLYVDAEVTWLIEVKDYRAHRRSKAINLGDEVAIKVRDTLAGLAAAQCNANDQEERRLASQALQGRRFNVVLHLEQPEKQSKLFPRAVDPANVKIKLKQTLRAVDCHPKIVNQNNLTANMGWTVTG